MKIDLNDLRNFDTPLFPVSVAAQAALIAPGTMRMWFHRERIKLHEMEAAFDLAAMPEKPGLPRMLTLRAVLALSAAAALARKGVDVADAYRAAKVWTHAGEGQSSHGINKARDPACLFAMPDWTMLVHYIGDDARVLPVSAKDGLTFQYSDLFGRGGPVPTAPTIVNLNKVDQHARGVCEGSLR